MRNRNAGNCLTVVIAFFVIILGIALLGPKDQNADARQDCEDSMAYAASNGYNRILSYSEVTRIGDYCEAQHPSTLWK